MADDSKTVSGLGMTAHFTSADTTLTWDVTSDAATIKAGTVTWSPAPLDHVAEEHAVTLLRVAEASWVEDCPEVPPPASVLRRGSMLSASRLDADGESLASAARAVSENWQEIASRQRACAQARAATPAAARVAPRR